LTPARLCMVGGVYRFYRRLRLRMLKAKTQSNKIAAAQISRRTCNALSSDLHSGRRQAIACALEHS